MKVAFVTPLYGAAITSGGGIEGAEAHEDAEERLLGEIFRDRAVPHHRVSEVDGRSGVPFDQRAKGGLRSSRRRAGQRGFSEPDLPGTARRQSPPCTQSPRP